MHEDYWNLIKIWLLMVVIVFIVIMLFVFGTFITDNEESGSIEELKSCTEGCHYVYENVINTTSDSVVINGVYHKKELGCMKFCYNIAGDE